MRQNGGDLDASIPMPEVKHLLAGHGLAPLAGRQYVDIGLQADLVNMFADTIRGRPHVKRLRNQNAVHYSPARYPIGGICFEGQLQNSAGVG